MVKRNKKHKRLIRLLASLAVAILLVGVQTAYAGSTYDESGFGDLGNGGSSENSRVRNTPGESDDDFSAGGPDSFSFSGAAVFETAKPPQRMPAPVAYGPEADFIMVPRQDFIRMTQANAPRRTIDPSPKPAPKNIVVASANVPGAAATTKNASRDVMRDRCVQVLMNSARYTKRIFEGCRGYVNRADQSYAAWAVGN